MAGVFNSRGFSLQNTYLCPAIFASVCGQVGVRKAVWLACLQVTFFRKKNPSATKGQEETETQFLTGVFLTDQTFL